MRKTIFYVLSAVLWGGCLGLVALVWLEHLGGYDLLKEIGKSAEDEFELYQGDYYGQPLSSNPYEPYSVQHLHPFYLFSLPWTADGIAEVKSTIVSLNALGFRNSLSNGAARKGVILGGSTAFGAMASSDQTTLASALNKIQDDYDFLNYGVPSWNSHQEMVAYTKIPFETDFVISFSGVNDFRVAHHYCRMGYGFPLGSPESFEYLAEITDDLRGERKSKGLFADLFPRTHKKITKLYNKVTGSGGGGPECRDRILAAADAFLANQRVVRDLVAARGGAYLLVLQPHLNFLEAPEKDLRREQAELLAGFYHHVAESEFCRTTPCLDLSLAFDGIVPLLVNETPDNPNSAIFADRVHLTDFGTASVAELVGSEIRR